jgi:hypothetical protein
VTTERRDDATLSLPYRAREPLDGLLATDGSGGRAARLVEATRRTLDLLDPPVSRVTLVAAAVLVYGVLDTASTAAAWYGPLSVHEASPLVRRYIYASTRASLPVGTWLLLGFVKTAVAYVTSDLLSRGGSAGRVVVAALTAYTGYLVVTNLLLAAGWSV